MEVSLQVIEFKGDQAVLSAGQGEPDILWPRQYLPENINEGDSLNFILSESSQDNAQRQQLAKDILNEILNVEE